MKRAGRRACCGLDLTRQDPIDDADGAGHTTAQGGKRCDDRYGDQGAGDGILNRGQAIFVAEKINEFRFHL